MQLNLLIIDDETLAIEGVKAAISLSDLLFENIYTACNVRQAMDVVNNNPVDIILCDIEMPQGNGLDFLATISETHPYIQSIILSCHDEFHYAKTSLQLGCMDYLLKPATPQDLECVIKKAIQAIRQNQLYERYKKHDGIWHIQETMLYERFWQEIINETIPPELTEIRKVATQRNISFFEDKRTIPILIHVQTWAEKTTPRDERLQEFALKNIFEEIVLINGTTGHALTIHDSLMLGLYCCNDTTNIFDIKANCEMFIQSLREFWECDLCCYIGQPVYPSDLSACVNNLKLLRDNNIAMTNSTILLQDKYPEFTQTDSINFRILKIVIDQDNINHVKLSLLDLFDKWVISHEFDVKLLLQFQQDFLQSVYIYLNNKGIQAHQLLHDNNSIELYRNASKNVLSMKIWIEYILERADFYTKETNKTGSVVENVKKHVANNLFEKITCKSIADAVFLNPDYLTKYFKKETGQTLSDYIVQSRMEAAKTLLRTTDMPVSAISSTLCYDSPSHFSLSFRKRIGVPPNNYRKTCEKTNEF